MRPIWLAVIFIGQLTTSIAQDFSGPWSDGHVRTIQRLQRSFRLPPPATKAEEPVSDTSAGWDRWRTVDNYTFGKNRGDMPMIADLGALHPYFRDQVIQLIEICRSKGIELAVVETYRTVAKQNEYKQLGKIYTRSSGGKSKHQYGLAVDVVPIIDCIPSWHNEVVWRKVGQVGEKLGLRWGGRWRHPYDPGHFEWSGGVSSTAMAAGQQPRVPHPEKYPCLHSDVQELQSAWTRWEEEQRGYLQAKVDVK